MIKWILAVALLAITSAGAAQSKPEAAIHYRQNVFGAIVWNFGPMSAMVRGKIPYDKVLFERHAIRVSQLAPMLLEGFPKGSEAGAETEARSEIWANWADFQSKMKTFEVESAALARLAKVGTLDAVKAQFGKVGASCKACHDKYKAE